MSRDLSRNWPDPCETINPRMARNALLHDRPCPSCGHAIGLHSAETGRCSTCTTDPIRAEIAAKTGRIRHRPGRKAERNIYDELRPPLPGDHGTGQHLATAATPEASAIITAALNHAEAAGILEPIRQQHAAAALAAHQTFVDEIHAGALEEIREKLRHHLHAGDDPCQDRGVPWPCDVAEALGITK